MQMAVEPLVKVLPQLIEVFSRVKLLKMHVSRQRCQWLGIGIWETCFVRGKRLIHAFYTEGGVARGLEHFLYKDVERQSPNIPIGFSYIARLRKHIYFASCNADGKRLSRISTIYPERALS